MCVKYELDVVSLAQHIDWKRWKQLYVQSGIPLQGCLIGMFYLVVQPIMFYVQMPKSMDGEKVYCQDMVPILTPPKTTEKRLLKRCRQAYIFLWREQVSCFHLLSEFMLSQPNYIHFRSVLNTDVRLMPIFSCQFWKRKLRQY